MSKLTEASEFKAVLAANVRVKGNGYFALASPTALGQARLGLVAGRKAAKRAVDRNRAKRIAREAFRASRASLPSADIVLRLRNDLRSRDNRSIRAELDHILAETSRRTAQRSQRMKAVDQ